MGLFSNNQFPDQSIQAAALPFPKQRRLLLQKHETHLLSSATKYPTSIFIHHFKIYKQFEHTYSPEMWGEKIPHLASLFFY